MFGSVSGVAERRDKDGEREGEREGELGGVGGRQTNEARTTEEGTCFHAWAGGRSGKLVVGQGL